MATRKDNRKARPTEADIKAAEKLRKLWNATPLGQRPTQEQLAAQWPDGGVTQGAISQYLKGRIPLNAQAVMRFADALRIHPLKIRDDLPELRRLSQFPANEEADFNPFGDSVRDMARTDRLTIPRFDVQGSMGLGVQQPIQETIVGAVTVSREWLRTELRQVTSPSNLSVITGYGDSMEGTFNDGSQLIVDRGVVDVRVDAVYVLSLNGELYIKRLQRRPDGSILMISDNRKYESIVIKNGEKAQFSVLGRVVGAWTFAKL